MITSEIIVENCQKYHSSCNSTLVANCPLIKSLHEKLMEMDFWGDGEAILPRTTGEKPEDAPKGVLYRRSTKKGGGIVIQVCKSSQYLCQHITYIGSSNENNEYRRLRCSMKKSKAELEAHL